MVGVDSTVVNVALPNIQKDLHFSPTGLSWVLNAYTSPSAACSCSAAGSATSRAAAAP